jgi:hypothetical protein
MSAARKYEVALLPFFYELKAKGCVISAQFCVCGHDIWSAVSWVFQYNKEESLSAARKRLEAMMRLVNRPNTKGSRVDEID